jgi:ATP-binding cassette subfamily C protein CydC
MSEVETRPRSAWTTLREVIRVGAVPLPRLLLSTGFGVAAALSTVGLMACAGALIDKAAFRPPLYTLTVLMAAVQILALCRGPLRYVERLVSHDAALRILGRLRLWLYGELEPRSPAGLRHWRGGDLLARATEDIDTLQALYLRGISPMVVAAVTSTFAIALLALILPLAGAVLAGGLWGALALTSTLAWLRHHRLGTREVALRGEMAADIAELFEGAADMTAFGLDQVYLNQTLACDADLTALAGRRSWTAGAINATSSLFLGLTVVGLLSVGIPAIATHKLPGFMLAVLPLVAFGSFEVVGPAADAVSRLSEQIAAAARFLAIADLEIPVTDPVVTTSTPTDFEIEVVKAQLRYGDDQPWALDGFTMPIASNSRVALVGASGAGKSSVVNILLRFWTMTEGSATIGGVQINALAQETTRSLIGWIAQDTHLFNTTIRANIALGRFDADEIEIIKAAQTAQLGPWIDSLPDGLDTKVGEDGARVSGGQRQRIALARALLADTPVLILDEPTSGLDDQMASRLLEDVLAATVGKTLLYITHRSNELRYFDQVWSIDNGKVVRLDGPNAGGEALIWSKNEFVNTQ